MKFQHIIVDFNTHSNASAGAIGINRANSWIEIILLESNGTQPEGIADNGNRTEAHGGRGYHRAQKKAEKGIEDTGSNRYA